MPVLSFSSLIEVHEKIQRTIGESRCFVCLLSRTLDGTLPGLEFSCACAVDDDVKRRELESCDLVSKRKCLAKPACSFI